MFRKLLALSVLATGLGFASAASATTYTTDFSAVTSNSGFQTQVASELSASWTAVGATDLRVVVSFFGSTVGTVEELYFLNPGFLGGVSVTSTSDSTHIQFALGATPGQLPGAASYNADPISAAQNGENDSCNHSGRGLCVGNRLTLDIATTGLTDSVLLSALNNGTLGLGVHIIAIGGINGTSDSFVSLAPSVGAPEPGSLALLGAGLLGLAVLRRKR